MNLYELHTEPEDLLHFAEAQEVIPRFFWEKYKDSPAELKKRERFIAKDAEFAYTYARDILKGPFPMGEASIARDSDCALDYAAFILNKRFPKGEAAIATNSTCSYQYALSVLRGRFPEGEKTIAADPYTAYHYAKCVIKGRFIEGEKALSQENNYYKVSYDRFIESLK